MAFDERLLSGIGGKRWRVPCDLAVTKLGELSLEVVEVIGADGSEAKLLQHRLKVSNGVNAGQWLRAGDSGIKEPTSGSKEQGSLDFDEGPVLSLPKAGDENVVSGGFRGRLRQRTVEAENGADVRCLEKGSLSSSVDA